MIKTQVFHKEVQSSDEELFRFIGGAALDSSLTIVMENEDSANTLTYKIQESADGSEWEDKELSTGSGTAVEFAIGPETAHTIKLPNTSTFYRVVARGSLRASVGLIWFTRVNPATAATPQVLA